MTISLVSLEDYAFLLLNLSLESIKKATHNYPAFTGSLNFFFIEYLSTCLSNLTKCQIYSEVEVVKKLLIDHIVLICSPDSPFADNLESYDTTTILTSSSHISPLMAVVLPNIANCHNLSTLSFCLSYNAKPEEYNLPNQSEDLLELGKFVLDEIIHSYVYTDDVTEKDLLKTCLISFLNTIPTIISKYSIFDQEFMTIIRFLPYIVEKKFDNDKFPLVELLISDDSWLNDNETSSEKIAAKLFQSCSFLGPLLSGSVIPYDDSIISDKFFISADAFDTNEKHDMESQSIQNTVKFYWMTIFNFFRELLKIKLARNRVVEFLAKAVNLNVSRAKMIPQELQLCSEGFCINLSHLLLSLSKPINISTIDFLYPFRENCKIKYFQESTSIFGSQEDTENFRRNIPQTQKPVNFSTECFFLTAMGINLGLMATLRRQSKRQRIITEFKNSINQLKEAKKNSRNSQINMKRHDFTLKRLEVLLNRQYIAYLSANAILTDQETLSLITEYFAKMTYALLEAANQDPETSMSKSDVPPDNFAYVPEWFIENIAEFLLFCLNSFDITSSSFMIPYTRPLVNFTLFIICHAHFFRNPYLVAKYVEILFYCDPMICGRSNVFYDETMSHVLARTHLVSSLIKFYNDVETTGSSNEFYDKFSIRYNIATIFITLWKSGFLKNDFFAEAERNPQNFVKFTNRIINDMSFLLEESLDGLKRIHELEDAQSNPGSSTPEEANSQAQELSSRGSQVISYMTLTNQTVVLLAHLTSEIKTPFLQPEIIGKLAVMLNFNLVQLCGPKCNELKVRNSEKYGWRPKNLLKNLITIYLQLDADPMMGSSNTESTSESMFGRLAISIGNDERCYKEATFRDSISLMARRNIVSDEKLEKFKNLVDRVQEYLASKVEDELEYDDIPAEFRDSLMDTLMKNPVMLPSSRSVLDKSTILRHLLNDESDPFNRQPLKENMLIPMDDLKQRIDTWLKERRSQKKNSS